MAGQKQGASKMYADNAAKMMNITDSGKKDPPAALSFGVNPSEFATLKTNDKAVKLFNACSDAFSWAVEKTTDTTSNVENPPQLQQEDWTLYESKLITNCAGAGAFTKNAGVQGRGSVSFTPQQQSEYAKSFGVALAQGLDDSLAGRDQNIAYGADLKYVEMVKANIMSIYTSAYYVYYQDVDHAGTGDTSNQDAASNLGRNLLIGIALAGAAAAGLYWYSKTQKAKANPSEMQLYQINDEQESITLDEFLSDNSELDPEDVAKIKSLKVEETFHSGGGAQPEWKIRRVY